MSSSAEEDTDLDTKDPKVKLRVCLGAGCGRSFKSSHKFNRMCSKCKSAPKSVEWSTWDGEVLVEDLGID